MSSSDPYDSETIGSEDSTWSEEDESVHESDLEFIDDREEGEISEDDDGDDEELEELEEEPETESDGDWSAADDDSE